MYYWQYNSKHSYANSHVPERKQSFVGAFLLRSHLWIAILFVPQFFLFVADTHAQEVVAPYGQEVIDPDREASVKAVFLYSYGRYVTWPKSELTQKSEPFVIGVLGDSAVTSKLQRIATKRTISGHTIEVKRVKSVDKLPHCHILFVAGHTDEKRQKAIAKATEKKPILVVGETYGFAEHGAAINFYVSGMNVRFQINANEVRKRDLQLNAKLLNLGDRVGGPPKQ